MQHPSKISTLCTKEHKQSEPVTGNENDGIAMLPKTMWYNYMKAYIQWRWQDPKYHVDETKHDTSAI